MTSDIAVPKRNGLAVLADTIIAPSAAFESLKAQPRWLWAYLITCVLGMAGLYLQVPGLVHASNYLFTHDPKLLQLPAEQAASTRKIGILFQTYFWLAVPLTLMIGIGITLAVLAIFNAVVKGGIGVARLFALAANVAILNFGISLLLLGIIVRVRGGDSFQLPADITNSLPSLAWLMPGAPSKIHAFFSTFTIFQIWSAVLLALGLRALGRFSAPAAWGAAIVVVLPGALFAAAGAR